MPRYVIIVGPCQEDSIGSAETVLVNRYPEIAIELRSSIGADVWRIDCHAPSTAHIDRWLEFSQIPLRTLNARSEFAEGDQTVTTRPQTTSTASHCFDGDEVGVAEPFDVCCAADEDGAAGFCEGDDDRIDG